MPVGPGEILPCAAGEDANPVARTCVHACLALCAWFALTALCAAQGYHHPFAVGANEGIQARQTGIAAWVVEQESHFYLLISGAIRLVRTGGGLSTLLGLSFAYGVFHAAGPGHGKAVVSSYVVSNERALRRGLVISLAAALLQAGVAVGLVSVAAFAFHATAAGMTGSAHVLEIASYLGIIALGGVLLWRKGAALLAALRFAPAPQMALAVPGDGAAGYRLGAPAASRFIADDCTEDHVHGIGCSHFHAPDPRTLGRGFTWRGAAVTVATAGARPCSGAILVLVFALAQNVYYAGILAALAMGFGTALTTGALAAGAVLFKGLALRLLGSGGGVRTLIVGRAIEVAAAACVMIFGLLLMLATLSGVGGA